jgi:hypothetical protein
LNYSHFADRWLKSGGTEHANDGLFLPRPLRLAGCPSARPTTDNPAQVMAHFWGATAKKVQPLLATLASLALLRVVEEENAYDA